MLEGLDHVDWGSLHHAYGPATDVPGQIRALASADVKVRGDAPYELFGSIWHQGTVYEATSLAVPFLIELVRSPSIEGKVGILSLLSCLATEHHRFQSRLLMTQLDSLKSLILQVSQRIEEQFDLRSFQPVLREREIDVLHAVAPPEIRREQVGRGLDLLIEEAAEGHGVVHDLLILLLRAGDADRLRSPNGLDRVLGDRHDILPAGDLRGSMPSLPG